MIDQGAGNDELNQLADRLQAPCMLGDYRLEGRIRKTSTALVFIAAGGVFGKDTEGVLKLTGQTYAPVLERELGLLNWCSEVEIEGIVRPTRPQLEWLTVEGTDGRPPMSVSAMLMPFLSGGDLVQWIGEHATRTGRLGAHLGLQVGEQVGGVLRDMLRLPRPLVHLDVKPQNVLLPFPGAPLTELTLIDLDASEELDIPLEDFASAPREIAELLQRDVHGFGELLFVLATGREPPTDSTPDPHTGNAAFDRLVIKCLTAEAEVEEDYVCLADNRLWKDLNDALDVEKTRPKPGLPTGRMRVLMDKRALAGIGGLLFVGLVAAIASKVFFG
ncbi:MAG TPA: hypothetical protein VKV73_26890 [Chloroflexota bacterium]|nr:hypothetical protein [Chloroflexota bacterium]